MSGPEQLLDFICTHRRLAVLTGAGLSTASGIPDYRDANGHWKHARPVQYADFLNSEATRQRYWARSMIGWPRMAAAEPNAAHDALSALERAGILTRLITQNVDGLHQKAGSTKVIDLHGRLDSVACLSCTTVYCRSAWQQLIRGRNPGWDATVTGRSDGPDGDAILDDADYSSFDVPACPECSGIVKPEVVFFGESVPRRRVRESLAAIDAADALLVAGSSLMVFSGFRFARYAAEHSKPVALVNLGYNRAEDLASLKLNLDCSIALAFVAARFPLS